MIHIHPTATVDPGAMIGDFTSVWHYCHVEGKAIIGENCKLGQNVHVGNNAVVGHACRPGNSVGIFSQVELGDFVFCAPFMVFTHIGFPRAAVSRRATFMKTRVGTGSTLTRSTNDWAFMVGVPARHIGWVNAFGEKIPLPLEGSDDWTCTHTGDHYTLIDTELERVPGPDDLVRYTPRTKLARLVVNPPSDGAAHITS